MTDRVKSSGLSAQKQALLALEEMQERLDAAERTRTEPIAIIGMGMRFPGGVTDPDSYWRLLSEGWDAVGEFPKDRWDFNAFHDTDPDAPGKMHVHNGGFLDDVAGFDAQFFGISPREAMGLDPQQRLLLEVSWEALENAGIAPDRIAGSKTGIYVGVMADDYAKRILAEAGPETIDAYYLTGTQFSFTAGRISYVLGVHGPAVAVDTACSSSLVAIHLACQSLRAGESDLALAGGVNLLLSPESTISMCKFKALSEDGRCKTFDESADGFARGEGAGVIALKRLSDAITDGDNIVAVIHGSAMNHDGRSGGLTVPNGRAQQAMLRSALEHARVKATEIDYVEAHGTGTPLGDPIEVRALGAVLCESRSAQEPLLIGSVKSNLGHLDSAAGVAGLMKLALSIERGEIPPSLHLETLNPAIADEDLPIEIPTVLTPWPRGRGPRYGGVSAFGLSGTNTHFILGEPPAVEAPERVVERPVQVLALSAKTESALQALASSYSDRVAAVAAEDLGDLCASANQGRAKFEHRLAAVASGPGELAERLTTYAAEGAALEVVDGHSSDAIDVDVAFLFTGQGSQYVGMGRRLYETEPVFRAALDRCDEILRPHLERTLLSVIFDDADGESLLNETMYTQPALFALEYSLATLWRSWGVEPAVVMGHSVGEYAAACFAGLFSLEDGLKLIATRGRLMQSLPKDGSMAVVFAPESRVAAAIAPHADTVSLAAVNGPESVVISGAVAGVEAASAALEADGFQVTPLKVSHAFHSPLMDPILDEFEQTAAKIDYLAPTVPLLSNLTGEMIDADNLTDAAYWREHIRAPVRFAQGIETLHRRGLSRYLEVGPSPTLLGMGRRCITEPTSDELWVPSLRGDRDDWEQLLESLGTLFVSGCDVDWAGFDAPYSAGRQRVALPTYPFQRQRFWFEGATGNRHTPATQRGTASGHPLLGSRLASPLRDIQFETVLTADSPRFMRDHQIFGAVVVPGTAFIEMALAAARAALGAGNHRLDEITFPEALILPADPAEGRTVQVVLTPDDQGGGDFRILSQTAADEWKLHASGSITPGAGFAAAGALDAARGRCRIAIDVDEFYARYRTSGLEYGTAFRAIGSMWRGPDEILGELELSDLVDVDTYRAHPSLIDAALQLVLASTFDPTSAERPAAYLPVQIAGISVDGPLPARLWGHARTRHHSRAGSLMADIDVYDAGGTVVAALRGVQLKRASEAAMQRMAQPKLNDWLYEVRWEQDDLDESTSGEMPEPGSWLIFADDRGVGTQLAAHLEAAGDRCTMVVPSDGAARKEGPERIDPGNADEFADLVRRTDDPAAPLRGALYLWGIGSEAEPADPGVTAGALHAFQALTNDERVSDLVLWLVTRGSQPVPPDPAVTSPSQAPLWGLGGVITSESPDLSCVRIDLDPWPEADEIDAVVSELRSAHQETQVAFRRGERYRARLARRQFVEPGDELLAVPPDTGFRLTVDSPGILDTLRLEPMVLPEPGPGEVMIQVQATGLNFKDVLKALGRYPIAESPLGDECAGVVTAVGEGVDSLHVGDRVAAAAYGSFRSHVTTGADLAVAIPDSVELVDAAAMPITYLTAAYTLSNCAGLAAGQRVLIHAGAGGVGMVAIQLAKAAGAEIFATAGSPRKRAILRGLGVHHVMDSRTLEFAEEIDRITGGTGVDVVLNSLRGEFIAKSLECLAEGGTFVEIGRTDIWDAASVAAIRPDVSYYDFYLGDVVEDDPALIQEMLQQLMAGLESGRIERLPVRSFALEEVAEAYRYMAQAKHIGKIVVTRDDRARPQGGSGIRGDATYLITGGLGGIGLETAQWMAEQGAKHLVLVGRSGARGAARDAVRRLEEAGVAVKVGSVDVSDAAQVAELFADVDANMPPLRGIIHSAAVIDDGALIHQTPERLERVFAPKVAGAWNLHVACDGRPLDFFVLFSSWAVLVGLPGQGNYVAANAFLDALAHHRRSNGMAGLSVNWGAWASVGLAASMDEQNRRMLSEMGVDAFAPELGIAALARVLESSPPQIAVCDIDWTAYFDYHQRALQVPYFSAVAAEAEMHRGEVAEAGARQEILAAYPSQSRGLVEEELQKMAARVLRLPVAEVKVDEALKDLGLDSLMTTELFAQIERTFGERLPLSALIAAPSVSALATLLAETQADDSAAEAFDVSSQTTAPQVVKPSWDSLVPIRSEGSRRPVFLIHAEGGNVLMYRDLADHLGEDQPVYALQAQGLDGGEIVDREFEEIAAHYVEEIRKVQPHGPYFLGGYCLGGALAYDMARQLQAAGEETDQVVMIQIRHRDHILGAVATLRGRFDRMLDRWDYEWFRLAPLSLRKKARYVSSRIGRLWTKLETRAFRPGSPLPQRLRTSGYLQATFAKTLREAYLRYEPEPYDGSVVVIRASRQPRRVPPDGTLGWDHLIRSKPEIITIDAYHQTIMKEPQIAQVAKALESVLDPGHAERQ